MSFSGLLKSLPICLFCGLLMNAAVGAHNILMVTTNNGSLTASEAGRKSVMESNGYTVNTIWDGASQAAFNNAFASNRAVYLPDEATAGEIGYKLRETTIGVLSEHTELVDELGLCTVSTTTTPSATISIINNTHYTTNVFSLGPFTLGSTVYNIGRMGGTTASGAVVLATVGGSNSAVAVDTGAALANTYNGSNLAFGRRVQFPLPVSVNDGSTFGPNTLTLANRMLSWAAGLDRTVVLHWKLNETSGVSAADASGFNKTGTVTGTATWISAVRNNGFQFNGSTKIQATGLLNTPRNVSVAAWANLTAVDTSGSEVVSLGDYLSIRLDEGGVTKAYMYDGTAWRSVVVNKSFVDTGWHHFAAVFDDDNNTFKLYVDGVLAASVANTSSISYAGLGTDTVVGRHGNSSTNYDFTGIIDEVRVYNYAISATDVALLYGFVGHWKLSETSGTTSADSTIFAKNGTVTGGANWSTRCNGAGVFDFDGSSHYISITSASHLQPTESLTMAAWIRGDAWGSGADVDAIFRKGEGNPNNYQFAIANGRVALYLDTSDPDDQSIRGNTTLTAGVWYHVAATWDGSTVKIYVNGQLDNTPQSRTGTIGVDTRALYIGGYSGSDLFDGMIYDARLYNRALNQSEIAKLAQFVGHWKFAEGAGSTAADSTLLANNATLSGGATWATDCAGNNVFVTNGMGAIAQTSSAFTPPAVGSVSFWMRGAGTPAARGRLCGVNENWEVRQEPTGALSFDFGGSPYVGNEPFSTLTPVDMAGRWYHIAAVFSDVDNSFSVYVDGQLRTNGISPVDLVPQAPGILSFGTRTGSTEYWLGALRDFRIYSRKLCPAEIGELSGFIGHWTLDETTGTTAADSSLVGNHATHQNSPTLDINGPVDRAARFNGTNYSITNQIFDPPLTGTVAFWMRRSAPPIGRERFFGVGDNWEIWQDPDGLIRCDIGGDGRVGGFESVTSLVNKWYHVAACFDGVADTYKLYIDGVLEADGSMPMLQQSPDQLSIAARTGLAIERFHGDLDDLRFYNRVLCSDEIQEILDGGEPFNGVRIIKWVEIQ